MLRHQSIISDNIYTTNEEHKRHITHGHKLTLSYTGFNGAVLPGISPVYNRQ